MFSDRYGWLRACKPGIMVASRIGGISPSLMKRFGDAVDKALAESDLRQFVINFADVLAIFGETPENNAAINAGVTPYLRGCLQQAIADCSHAGIPVMFDANGNMVFCEKEQKPPRSGTTRSTKRG